MKKTLIEFSCHLLDSLYSTGSLFLEHLESSIFLESDWSGQVSAGVMVVEFLAQTGALHRCSMFVTVPPVSI